MGSVKLLIEELYILISKKNEGKSAFSEWSVFLWNDDVQIVPRTTAHCLTSLSRT